MKLKLPKIPNISLNMFRNNATLGIDIGTTGIKIVQTNGNKIVRWGYKELSIPDTQPDASMQDRLTNLKQMLSAFISSDKSIPKSGNISVNGNSVIVRFVKFPKLTAEELAQTIQFEAEPYIPFAIPEVNIGFHILGDVLEDGQQKMETVLVAAKKELIEQRLEVLTACGIHPRVVDVDAFTLENAFSYSNPDKINESTMIINIGASVTNIIIMEQGVSRVVRDVFISGNSINKSLQRIFDCSFEEAEKLKRKGKILVTPDEKEATLAQDDQDSLQVSNTIVTVLKDLVAEIQRSIDFFLSQNPERQISRILLSGGSTQIAGLDRYISQELRTSVELFDPFNGMSGDLPDITLRPLFAVAMGLSTRRETKS